MAGAVLDRRLHRSTVLKIDGGSYRIMEKKKAGAGMAEEAKMALKD